MIDGWNAWSANNSPSIVDQGAPLAALLKDHPHLRSAERFIEMVEMMPMPTK
jgi:hypothetical protein